MRKNENYRNLGFGVFANKVWPIYNELSELEKKFKQFGYRFKYNDFNTLAKYANQTGATYQWLDCNNGNAPISGATNISFTPTANGDYAVEITVNNCVDTSACENVTGVGIKAISDIMTNIYPNPVKDILNVVSKDPIEQAFIYNATGALVRTITTNLQTIPVSNLPQGMYILVLQSPNGIAQHRFVKE